MHVNLALDLDPLHLLVPTPLSSSDNQVANFLRPSFVLWCKREGLGLRLTFTCSESGVVSVMSAALCTHLQEVMAL